MQLLSSSSINVLPDRDITLNLIRFNFTANSTIGAIFVPGNSVTPLVWTLERPWKDGANARDDKSTPTINESTAILCNTYEVVPHIWGHNGWQVPMLVGTPNRSAILIHPANKPSELLGCIAPGIKFGQDCVISSSLAFNKVMAVIKPVWDKKRKVFITISNNADIKNAMLA
jgi:hypothetical protein